MLNEAPKVIDLMEALKASLEKERRAEEFEPPPALPTIGSSDVASILGLSRWGSPWETWARLVGLVPRYSDSGDGATARGNMFEQAIGWRYAAEHGVVLRPGPPIGEAPLVHPTEPWMAARPDFLAADREVEAKTSRVLAEEDGWGAPGTDRVPTYYAVQVVWQLAILAPLQGIERADLAAFGTLGEDWRVYVLHRRERLEQRLVARVRDWFERHVLEATPPVVDGSDGCGRTLSRLYRGRTDKVRLTPTAEDIALARDLYRVRLAFEDCAVLKKELEHKLQARIGEAYGIEGVADWAPTKGRKTIDAKALRKDHPEIADAYEREGEPSRRFTFTYTEGDSNGSDEHG